MFRQGSGKTPIFYMTKMWLITTSYYLLCKI
nr:MAG TPA: hypothetical protein [Caudoviricetes sp.]